MKPKKIGVLMLSGITLAISQFAMAADSIHVTPAGNVGFGTNTPTTAVEVVRADGAAKILVEETNATKIARSLFEIKNNGNPEFRMTNSGNGNSWLFSAGLRFVVKNNLGVWVSRVDSSGNMEITGSLTTAGGICGGGGCDLVFDPETKIETIEEHASEMWTNSYLPAVGPTVENEPFNLTEKTGGMLNELEKAHIYIEQLHDRLATLEAENKASAPGNSKSGISTNDATDNAQVAINALTDENTFLRDRLDRLENQQVKMQDMMSLLIETQQASPVLTKTAMN